MRKPKPRVPLPKYIRELERQSSLDAWNEPKAKAEKDASYRQQALRAQQSAQLSPGSTANEIGAFEKRKKGNSVKKMLASFLCGFLVGGSIEYLCG